MIRIPVQGAVRPLLLVVAAPLLCCWFAQVEMTAQVPTTTSIGRSFNAGTYTLTATVKGNGPAAPTGKVSFIDTSDGNKLLGTAELQAAPAAMTWTPGELLTMDSPPKSIAAGDYNGDGIPDLAVVGESGEPVRIFLSNGDGTFTRAAADGTEGLSGRAAGLVSGSAVTDFGLVGANHLRDGVLAVLVRNGDGTFNKAPDVPVGRNPIAVAVGDFNGDGLSDVAVANSGDGTVSILLGNGAGSFILKGTVPVGQRPNGIGTGDFNQDGKADLAVADRVDNTVTMLEGNGDGTFSPAGVVRVGNAPGSLAVADFNGDGVPDIAVANNGDNTVTVLLTQLTESATATLTGVAPTAAGSHNVEASYAGDSTYSSSKSSTIALTPVAETPLIAPAGGTYHKFQTVTITDKSPGAIVYYALHNATPSASSTKYTGPIAIASTNTVKAIAVAKGYENSAVAKAAYTIELPTAAMPTFLPVGGTYLSAQNVTIKDASSEVTIHYTTNGEIPTAASPIYSKAIPVAASETIRAIATGTNYIASKVATQRYAITLPTATPVIKPGTGSYPAAQKVTITDATPMATIYYTTDGKTPTTASTKYTVPITVPISASLQTIEAMAVADGYTESLVASATYTITPLVATPIFSPMPGTYSNPTPVTLSDTTENSTIYYTVNGQAPTTASIKYTGTAIQVNSNETIEALAVSGGNDSLVATGTYSITPGVAAPPTITTAPAQNGAVIVSLSTSTLGNGTIYYTTNGSTPTSSSPVYLAPILVASNLKLSAIAQASGYSTSPVASQTFALNIPSGTLVWSDEFTNTTGANAQPNPNIWTYDTGVACCGNNEWEDYCAWGSTASPCDPTHPNTYVGTDGYLHIIARNPIAGTPAPGNYTSARLKSQGLFSFQYGRFEARILVPEAQGLWPAGWLLGNNITTVSWPACGEQDVQERIDAAGNPDWNAGSIHAVNLNGTAQYQFPSGQTAAQWHTYGMIWKDGSVSMYVDDPAKPYVTYNASSYKGTRQIWPFDGGQANFIILNLAVGGDWPGPPNASTPFPSEMLVDYVRVYTN